MRKVFVILCDTLRAKSLPHYGNKRNTFPQLSSRIEKDFIVFNRAYAPAPWTIPSHISLFTGLYPSQAMEFSNSLRIHDNLPTLAGLFKDSGYNTVGISANALVSRKFNFHRDFDRFFQLWLPDANDDDIFLESEEGNRYRRIYKQISESEGFKVLKYYMQKIYKRRRNIIQNASHSTKRAFRILKNQVKENGSGKEFYFINVMQTHEKYNPPEKTRDTFIKNVSEFDKFYKRKTHKHHYASVPFSEELLNYLNMRYEEEILYLDIIISDFIRFLEKIGQYEDSVIVLTSDHGEHFGESGHFTHWFSVYEPVIKIPMYVKWPGQSENKKAEENKLFELQDLYSTFSALLDHWRPCPDSSCDVNSSHERRYTVSQLPDLTHQVEACRKIRSDFSLTDVGLREDSSSLNAYILKDGTKIIENGDKLVKFNLKQDPEEKKPVKAERNALETIKSDISD